MESNIRMLREKMGLTQAKLGDIIGVSQQVVSRMENDRNTIQADVLLKLAGCFGVSTDYVLGYPGESEKLESMLAAIQTQILAGESPDLTSIKLEKMNSRNRKILYQIAMILLNAQS